MYLGSINVEKPPKLGDEIYAEGLRAGQIINFYKKDDGLYRILFEMLIEKINLDLMLHDSKITIREIS